MFILQKDGAEAPLKVPRLCAERFCDLARFALAHDFMRLEICTAAIFTNYNNIEDIELPLKTFGEFCCKNGHLLTPYWRAVRPVDALSVIAAFHGVKPIFASALFFALPFPEWPGWLPDHYLEILRAFRPFLPASAFGLNVPNHVAVAKFDINAFVWWAAALVNRHWEREAKASSA